MLRTISVLGFAVAALSTVVAVRALLDGYRPARYFLLAWAGLLVFILFGALRNFALVPTNFVTIYGLHIGFALDVLLLSFALGDRISIAARASARRRTRRRWRRSSCCSRRRARTSASWRRRIAVRTAELNSANERLRAEASERESLMQLLRHQEEHLRFMAQHDPLTGLPNRTSMHQRLALALELAKRNRKKVAVMMVDLDEFKRINDTRGHPGGRPGAGAARLAPAHQRARLGHRGALRRRRVRDPGGRARPRWRTPAWWRRRWPT